MLIVGAPPGFREILGALPEEAEVVETTEEPLDVVILFITDLDTLHSRFSPPAEMLSTAGGLWVAWPKKASKIESDLSFELVQGFGLGAGMVDNKSCSIDADWQGLRFVYRKRDRRV